MPTTSERLAGSVTNGVANADASAQSYSAVEDAVVRPTAKSRPPLAFIHSTCALSRISVASAGVL